MVMLRVELMDVWSYVVHWPATGGWLQKTEFLVF